MSVPRTRQKDMIFLLGVRELKPLQDLNQLPTIRQVLLRLHYYLLETKNLSSACQKTVNELIIIWEKAGIPIRQKYNCISKLEGAHKQWLLLNKNKGRPSESQRSRESLFVEKIDGLFDIAHNDAPTMCKISQDLEFLLDQRGRRKMVMSVVDKAHAEKQIRIQQRIEAEKRRLNQVQGGPGPSSSSSVKKSDFGSDLSSEDTDDDVNDETYKASISEKKLVPLSDSEPVSKKLKTLYTKHVTSALDRNKVSDREALRLIVPIATALGHDPNRISLSRSTIRRRRKDGRKSGAEEIKQTFSCEGLVVVHWDGKILPDITGSDNVERLPVLVSANGIEKLLGVPRLQSGTGSAAADAVETALRDWELTDKVQAMSFDTTSVNTGTKSGCCTLLERKIGRNLLWLACRHHVLEIVLSKVFETCMGPSSSPDIPVFKRFKAVWAEIDQSSFEPLERSANHDHYRNSSVPLLMAALEQNAQPRDDYLELIELALVVLGEPFGKIHWRSPGPVHRARWMAKLIYAFKIYLFRQQDAFHLTARESSQLERFVLFGALLYVKFWIKAPCATEAPISDLNFWTDLVRYEEIDKSISEVARVALKNHLWYLSDELVGLSLFSSEVTTEEKVKIVEKMTTIEPPKQRMVRGNPSLLTNGSCLADFATKNTANLFVKLQISSDFLQLHPEEWEQNPDFIEGQRRASNMRVVNDTAERGVKLFEDFNKLITNNEMEKQILLQIVEANRKLVPTETTKKDAILACSSTE